VNLSRYRRLRWVLGFATLLAVLAAWEILARRPLLVVYNDLDTPLAGAVLLLPGAPLPLPPIAPGASISIACPDTAAGPVELLLPATAEPLTAGWLEPRTTASITIHLYPGPAVVVTTTPTLTGHLRRWLR
jgi:hypothetical protein